MSHPLRKLGPQSMSLLAKALRAGKLVPPYDVNGMISTMLPEDLRHEVSAALGRMSEDGAPPSQIATLLEVLEEEVRSQQQLSDRVELVFSPPELDFVHARDTSVVVRELFLQAKQDVLIASYALDKRAQEIFRSLAERLDEGELRVRIYINVHRAYNDETPAEQVVRAYAKRFRREYWPGERLPDVFYDPRSVAQDERRSSCMHAKCVVVDQQRTFLTSANFTEAAQERNIEAGVVIDDANLALRIHQQFARLVEARSLIQLPFH